jgi:hypothetical protein
MRDVQPDPVEELKVRSELELLVDLGLQEAVAKLLRIELTARSDGVSLVLRRESRALSGGTLRSAELEEADRVGRGPPWLARRDPRAGDATESLPPVSGTEQGAAVAPDEPAQDVAILVIEIRADEEAHVTDGLRIGSDRKVLRGCVGGS